MGVHLLIDGLHPLSGERAGILDAAIGKRVNHPARTVLVPKSRILRVVVGLRLFLSIQMVEVAEKLVETMVGRQMLVLVAEVILPELACGVTFLLEEVGDRRRPVGDTVV